MDPVQALVAELAALTREMSIVEDPSGDAFGRLISRRGELIEALCRIGFDPSDERLATILQGGNGLLVKIDAWRDSLRLDLAGLEQTARLVGGVKSTLSQPRAAGIDISA